MPSAAASERGSKVAEAILESHRRDNGGAWPQTVSVSHITHSCHILAIYSFYSCILSPVSLNPDLSLSPSMKFSTILAL